MSNNNTSANPFSKNVNRTRSSYVQQGEYLCRINSMQCWTHASAAAGGGRHAIPTMGLILQVKNTPNQIFISLTCPEDARSYEGYTTKLARVLEAVGMDAEDFYVCQDQEGDALPEDSRVASPVLKDRQHPRNPVGKSIQVRVSPNWRWLSCKGDPITREVYQQEKGTRPLLIDQCWREADGTEYLAEFTGYYSLDKVM